MNQTKIVTLSIIFSILASIVSVQILGFVKDKGLSSKAGYDSSLSRIINPSLDSSLDELESIIELSKNDSKDGFNLDNFNFAYSEWVVRTNQLAKNTNSNIKLTEWLPSSDRGPVCTNMMEMISQYRRIANAWGVLSDERAFYNRLANTLSISYALLGCGTIWQ